MENMETGTANKISTMDTRHLNYETVKSNIRKNLKNYIVKHNIKSLVCGISGGIDSCLCVALALPVCKELGVAIIGRSISILTNKPDEKDRAKKVGEEFCTDFKEVDLSTTFNNLYADISEFEDDGFSEDVDEKINKGNVKARIRMIYLYNLARKHKGIVLSTDNYTELLLSFFTLHGDVGDYGMIQNLWKHEVYNLSRSVNEEYKNKEPLQLCIDANPTDGLGITNSDLDQLGASSYDEVDQILINHISEINGDKNHPVIKRHLTNSFKRENPYNIPFSELISD